MPDMKHTDIKKGISSSFGIEDTKTKRCIDDLKEATRLNQQLLEEVLGDLIELKSKQHAPPKIEYLIEGDNIKIDNMLGGRYKISLRSDVDLKVKGGAGRGGGSSVLPAKVVCKKGAFYMVDVYANGYDESATKTNVLVKVLMLNYADTLPAGTEILVAGSYIDVTGGGSP